MNGDPSAKCIELTELVKKTLKLLKNKRWIGGNRITGSLELDNEGCEIVKELSANRMISSIHIEKRFLTEEQVKKLAPDSRLISFVLEPESKIGAIFAENLDALLDYNDAKHRIQAAFYVADSGWHVRGGNTIAGENELARTYFATIRLIGILKDISDHQEETGTKRLILIFLEQEKLELPIEYSSNELRQLGSLDRLAQILDEPIHQTEKQAILKRCLIGSLIEKREEKRFSLLLEGFNNIFERFERNYRVYASEFSFEKVMAEVQRHKLEYTAKLNKVFTDVQNKLLAIPAALILIGGQMKSAEEATLNNFVILLGGIIFAMLMFMLLSNQKHTLNAINHEIAEQRREIRLDDNPELDEKIANAFDELHLRYYHQVTLLRIVWWLVVFGLIFTLAMFIWITPAIRNSITSLAENVLSFIGHL
jgi:hypothetical protein